MGLKHNKFHRSQKDEVMWGPRAIQTGLQWPSTSSSYSSQVSSLTFLNSSFLLRAAKQKYDRNWMTKSSCKEVLDSRMILCWYFSITFSRSVQVDWTERKNWRQNTQMTLFPTNNSKILKLPTIMLLITHNSLTTVVDVNSFSKALQWRGYYLYAEQRVTGSHRGIS